MKVIFDIETTGLEAFIDRIISISVMDADTKMVKTFLGDDEYKILESFFKYISPGGNESVTLIGYNSDSFDIPFIIKRSLKWCLKVPKFSSIDLRKEASGFGFHWNRNAAGKLTQWGSFIGEPAVTDPGMMMAEYFEIGDWEKIKAHNEEDVKITFKLYLRCKECGLFD